MCSEVLASVKWHVTARYELVFIEVHISAVKLATVVWDTEALAFYLDFLYPSFTIAFKA